MKSTFKPHDTTPPRTYTWDEITQRPGVYRSADPDDFDCVIYTNSYGEVLLIDGAENDEIAVATQAAWGDDTFVEHPGFTLTISN